MLSSLLVAFTALSVARDTLVVRSHGGELRTLAAAVARARANDIIRIEPGIYKEPMIVIDKPLTIIGTDWPVLDGEGSHQILTITADDVTVRGLVLRNVGTSMVEDRAAVKATKVHGCDISDNRIEHAFFGIYLAAVTDCRIANNILTATGPTEAAAGNGIHLWTSSRIHIEGNRISGHRDGIYFEFVHDSEIRDNTSTRNLRYGLHFMYSDDCQYIDNTFQANGAGVTVMYTKHVAMRGNRFDSNWGNASYGLLLKEVYDVQLERNHFVHNTVALVADGANRLDAEHNDFERNGWAVKLLASTDNGRIIANNFIGNTFDVATNSRESDAQLMGNYWDAYRGYDLDHDGMGDVPFHPVRLFSLLAQSNESSLLILRSVFVSLIDGAERALPSLTPQTLVDKSPSMRRTQ